MAKFQLGASVLKRDSSLRGVIIDVAPARRGRQIYRVNWDGKITDELEEDLVQDYNLSDPFERCSNGIFGSYSEYSKKNTSFKIKSSNNSTISSLKASKTLFRAYQFKPLLKFLNSPSRRLLVADEVGLGKTIEAGHIMLELKARRELQNVLIVCPWSLQEKWKGELQEKFGLSFRIYEKSKDLLEDLQYHNGKVRAIINYEKIRFKKNETKKAEQTGEPDNLISYLTDSGRKFSLVVCDEAHRLRNTGTLIYGGAEILMSLSDSALFLTATPVMISNENLYNLLHLLDNTRYFNYQIFSNLVEQNRPFISALSALNANVPLHSIKESLSTAEIYTTFSADEREIYSSYQARAGGQPMSPDSLLKELGRASTDATHQFAMLDLLEQMLGESEGELAQLVKDARAQLMAEKGADVKAGLNLAQEVNARVAAPEEMQGLRDLYRSEVLGFTKPQDCFRSLLAARGPEGLKGAISFLLAGCGADLAASNPSMDPVQLRQILLDLQCVDVLQTVLGDLDKLGARMQAQFGEACRLTGEQMTGRVLDFTEQAFVTAPGIGAFVGEAGLQALLAQMDFTRELVGLFRRLSPRLFGKETDRQKLVDAAQEHLDGLISLEDEAEQEKQEDQSA